MTNKIDKSSSSQPILMRRRHISSLIDLQQIKNLRSGSSLHEKSEQLEDKEETFSKTNRNGTDYSNLPQLKTVQLKETIHGQKVSALVKNFIRKLKRNNS